MKLAQQLAEALEDIRPTPPWWKTLHYSRFIDWHSWGLSITFRRTPDMHDPLGQYDGLVFQVGPWFFSVLWVKSKWRGD